MCIRDSSTKAVKSIAVAATVLTFLVSLLLFRNFQWWAGDPSVIKEAIFGTSYGTLHEVCKFDAVTVGTGGA